ncbi:RES domain-containing protein [Lentzea sp. BCCO 10_0798]|uniref:RES domain-containing protein n=1 Tax=Lentzea kristufekii TaxID=3095430 RepID=A0ABU4TN61_9PSEU|nr:RES domain-containing protein [Lentzea sp. BCCO 10_0798]MDX8049718.1 RES domain-containing protein [Lentzea sp. BCCO 10_0798]
MPDIPPPPRLTGTPVRETVPAGRTFYRVHSAALSPLIFDPQHSGAFGGGRFDACAGASHRTMCMSAAPETAIAERFLREFAVTRGVQRVLPGVALAGQVLSEVRTTSPLDLIRLYSAQDLAQTHQDTWLTTTTPDRFPATRQWAAWLHDQVPWADGILWQSIADMPRETVVLFDDRCTAPPDSGVQRALDSPIHLPWLTDQLKPYGVEIDPPLPSSPRFFINFRTGDAEAVPELLHRELVRRLGEKAVFYDVRSMRPGLADFADALEQNVRNCETVIAVVGRRWEHQTNNDGARFLEDPGDWVRKELILAHQTGKKVVPVLVGLRSALRTAALPEELHYLASIQVHHLRRGYGDFDIEQLVNELLHE